MEVVSESISEAQKETLKIQRDILAEIRADTNAMRADIGHLVGDNLERKIGFRLPALLAHRLDLSDLEVLLYQEREIVVDPELQDVIAEAYGLNSISQGQRRRLLDTDMIVKARRSDES